MTPTQIGIAASPTATCPLCHTVERAVTPEDLDAGATWACSRCGQPWSAGQLAVAAAYARFVVTHQSAD